MKLIRLLMICVFALVIPIFTFAQDEDEPQPPTKTIKLQVSNFVSNPETKLKEKDRKYECSMIDFNLTSFLTSDDEAKTVVTNKLKDLKIDLVQTEEEFIKLDKSKRSQTAIYERINDKTKQCPKDTTQFKSVTEETTKVDTSLKVTGCAMDDKSITVAINNYPTLDPTEIKDNSLYIKKIGDNFSCSLKKIPVKNPKSGIQANIEEITTYLKNQATGMKIVKDKTEFDSLSADDMKKAVILSTLKCKCEGPNSADYSGLSFKDKTEIEKRESTAKKIGVSYDPDPNKSATDSVTSTTRNTTSSTATKTLTPSGNSASNSNQTNQNRANPLPTLTPTPKPTPTANPAPYTLDNNCVTVDSQLICFSDNTSKTMYLEGQMTSYLKTTVGTVFKNISRSKDKRGYISIIIISSSSQIKSIWKDYTKTGKYADLTPVAFACQSTTASSSDLCYKYLTLALGETKARDFFNKSKSMKMIVATAQTDNGYSRSKTMFKKTIDHEWAHIYDTVSSWKGLSAELSQNKQYQFIKTYELIRPYPIAFTETYPNMFKTYPKCVGAVLTYSPGAGHPWDAPTETFASAFAIFNNQYAQLDMNNYFRTQIIDQRCKTDTEATVNQLNTFFN